jgi:hypothetical protein
LCAVAVDHPFDLRGHHRSRIWKPNRPDAS